jgi:hypothetical protein
MDLSTFHELLTSDGQAVLAAAAALAPTERSYLQDFKKLRKLCAAPLAQAALETAILQLKARTKFAAAERMYFEREALEQASGDFPASHRARRLAPFGVVADLCCGIGGDALAFARAGATVQAIEQDPVRAAMAAANAQALGLAGQVLVSEGNAITTPLPDVQAAFADPSRRSNERRFLDPEAYSPPLAAIRGRFAADFPLAVKVAPGVSWDHIASLPAEAEFVSVHGELKECVLWFGPMRTMARRATLLPSGTTLASEEAAEAPALSDAQDYVFDADAAIVRSGLAGLLARDLGLAALDPIVALYTGREAIASPWLKTYSLELADRFHATRLRDHLRAHSVGRVTIIKRGSQLDADQLLKKLKLEGSNHRVVILAKLLGQEWTIVGNLVSF